MHVSFYALKAISSYYQDVFHTYILLRRLQKQHGQHAAKKQSQVGLHNWKTMASIARKVGA